MKLQPSLDREKTITFARQLDSKLYQTAPSFKTYADVHTLDERLKKIATRIVLTATRRPTAQRFAMARQKLLRKKVGDNMYKEIINLVNEITKIRETNDLWTAVIQKKVVTNGESSSSHSAFALMPSELRGIYFGPRLVVATKHLFAKTSSLERERVEKPDWEEMLQEARDNVAIFRKFEAEINIGRGERIDYCTSFGCCLSRYPSQEHRIDNTNS